MSARARLALATLILAGVGVLLLGSYSPGVWDSRASRDRGPEGTAALAGVFGRMGYEVESLRLGLHVLSRRDPGLLFVVSPPGLLAWPALTGGDAARLLAWVEDGGTAVLVQDRPGPLLDALGVEMDTTGLSRSLEDAIGRPALPVRPSPWTRGGPLALQGRAAPSFDGSFAPLFSVRGTVVAAVQPRGDGQVVVVSDPSTLGNSGLGRGGNLAFYVAVARSVLAAGGPVYFDDLHAGGGDDHGVVAYARRAGGGPALVVVGLMLLLLLWRIGAREATAATVPPPPPILGGAEHIRALAGLYERAELGRHALDVTSRQFRRAVEERAGIPWELDRLDHWLRTELGEGAALDFARVRSGFGRLFAVAEPSTDAVLAVARLAARFERRWLGERRPPGKATSLDKVL
jgi:hypothetical protein